MHPDANPTAVLRMNGFDDLPRAFRDELNYGKINMSTPNGCAILRDALRAHPSQAPIFLSRLHDAMTNPQPQWLDAKLQNR